MASDPLLMESFRERARELVAQMTLEEKVSLTSGEDFWRTKAIPRLNLPSIYLTDGPHGLRKGDGGDFSGSLPATCFPTASLLAATWNPELIREVGVALGKECQAQGVDVLLGPGMNLKRSPLGGRNFEYFSEDPVLTGRLATAFVEGVQSEGVGATVKHFAANNQEFERMVNNSVVDERTLRELYLPAFEATIREARPWAVMCAYNRVNGIYASQHRELLHTILKEEWGFEGFVVSDWGAVDDRVAGIAAGLHLEMPSSLGITDRQVGEAVWEGKLEESRLDEVVTELVAVILRAVASRRRTVAVDWKSHHGLARKVAGEGIVLLKNDGLLPVDVSVRTRVAIIGNFARTPRYQGAGSSLVHPTELSNVFDELSLLAGPDVVLDFSAGYAEDGSTDEALLSEASEVAARADLALVFVGLPETYESEGFDRESIELPDGHNRLVEAVSTVQSRVAVVLMNGAAVSLPWVDRVSAIVEGWLGGQGGGGALADVLTGQTNPSGRLGETFPRRIEDTPSFPDFPGRNLEARYGEGLFVGYRHYDTRRIEPLFPFGHGLSYTRFQYEGLVVDRPVLSEDETVMVRVTLRNVGDRSGAEVVQLYLRPQNARLVRPEKELKGFGKIWLAAGEAGEVQLRLGRRDFAVWDSRLHDWVVDPGTFEILVGGSSRDLPLRQSLEVRATRCFHPVLNRRSMVAEFRPHPETRLIYDEFMRLGLEAFGVPALPEQTAAERAAKTRMEAMFVRVLHEMPVGKLIAMSSGALTEQRLNELLSATSSGLQR